MERLISIIMPVYNAAAFVEQAVRSVLNQTHTHWELLIIDDGSTDDTLSRIQTIPDPRIRIFVREHKGVSAARNFGLSQMRGHFVCFLDADDSLPFNSLKSRLDLFADDVDFVDGAVEFYDESFNSKLRKWEPRRRGSVYKRLFRLDDGCFFGPSWMIKVKRGIQYRFDETMSHGEDLLFFMSIARGGNYTYTKDVILHYRKHDQSAMRNCRALAIGYTRLREKMRVLFAGDLTYADKLVYDLKVRKIMFLTFLRTGKADLAFRYLFLGRI